MRTTTFSKILLAAVTIIGLSAEAKKSRTLTKERRDSVDLFIISIPVNYGESFRVTEWYEMNGSKCIYKSTTESFKEGADRPYLNSKDAPISKCYNRYTFKDKTCIIESELEDVTATVPLNRCYGDASSMTNNGWELSRSELQGTWTIDITKDVPIPADKSSSNAFIHINEQLKDVQPSSISCQIDIRGEPVKEPRNLRPRKLTVETIYLKREDQHIEVGYVVADKNSEGKAEPTRSVSCKVPNNFSFSDKSQFNPKKLEIDTELALVEILKTVGITLTTPPETTH